MRGRPIKPPTIEYAMKPNIELDEAQKRLDRIFEILFDDMVNSYPKGVDSFKSVAEILPSWRKWKIRQWEKYQSGEGGEKE